MPTSSGSSAGRSSSINGRTQSRWTDSRRIADNSIKRASTQTLLASEAAPASHSQEGWRDALRRAPLVAASPSAASLHSPKSREASGLSQGWQTDRARSSTPPGSRSRQIPQGRRSSSADVKGKEVVSVSQLQHRLVHMLRQVEPVQRRELISTGADVCLRACERRVLLRWAFTCFRHAAISARHAVQLESSQSRLAEMQDRLRRAEQRALVSEERLFQSEDIRRREKARLCKAELDQRRSMEWRRDYEARSPVAARAVAVAILSASFDGFVRGVTTLVLTVWSSLASRMRRAR